MLAEYDNNGRIYHIVNDPVPVGYDAQLRAMGRNVYYVQGEIINLEEHYIVNGVLQFRPLYEIDITKTTIAADGLDETILTNIPENTPIYIDDEMYVVSGTLTLNSDVPATYKIHIDNFPYMLWMVEVEAV